MQKFTTTAGPIQTKRVGEFIRHFLWESKGHIELTDHSPEGHRLTGMTDEPIPASIEAYNAIFAKYDGTITAKNHKDIIADFEAATAAIVLPVIDNRTTPEEREARRVLQDASRRENEEKTRKRDEESAGYAAKLRELYPWAVAQDGFKTSAARAAANLKKELTLAFPGIKFSVKSDSYSMGNSVDVTWSMGPSQRAVEKISNKYQHSSFNSMEDISEFDGSAYGRAIDQVLGRAKHVNAQRSDGWELKHKLAPAVCELYGKPCDNGIDSVIYENGDTHDLRRLLSEIIDGSPYDRENELGVSFPAGITLGDVTGLTRELVEHNYVWTVQYNQPTEPVAASTHASQSAQNYTVQKHYHEKRGVDFWLVVPAERMSEDDYRNELSRAKSAGGWQSRKWGKTPSGFGFAAEDAASRFAGITREPIAPKLDHVSGSWMCTKDGKTVEMYEQANADKLARQGWTVEIASDYLARINREFSEQSATKPASQATAERLRTLADGMTEAIEHAQRPLTQNWTHKRGREHASRVFEGEQLERCQKALRVLADHHEAGTVPPVLRGITTKSKILALVRNHCAHNHSTDCIYDNGEPANHSAEAVALRALMASPADAQAQAGRKAAQELQHAVDALRGVKIEGFFPTPEATASKMVDALDVKPGMSVLEPSAGIGSLCEAVRLAEPTAEIKAVEVRPSLADIVERKGFDVTCYDFTDCNNGQNGLQKIDGRLSTYDRVIMNPPFERGQDAKHTMHAFQFLKPGGRLVSLVSEGPFFRNDKASIEFREWLEVVGAEVEELPDAFTGSDAFRNTGVRVRMITVDAAREPIASETGHPEKTLTTSCTEDTREPTASETLGELLERAERGEVDLPAHYPDCFELNDWIYENHPEIYEATKYLSGGAYGVRLLAWKEAGEPDIHDVSRGLIASKDLPPQPGDDIEVGNGVTFGEIFGRKPQTTLDRYNAAKRPGVILIVRMGDFYEVFNDDAVLCAELLSLTKTSRTGGPVMVGFPYHQLWKHVDKLLKTHDVDVMESDGSIETHKSDDHDLATASDLYASQSPQISHAS